MKIAKIFFLGVRVARYLSAQRTKTEENICTKCPYNIRYNILQCKTLHNLPKLGFWFDFGNPGASPTTFEFTTTTPALM
jgi:hypothetical protein